MGRSHFMKPPVLLITLLLCASTTNAQSTVKKEVPTITFCEMVKNPHLYFDKTIRISATYEIGDEGSNLNDVRCVRSHDDSIGVGVATADDAKTGRRNGGFNKILSGKFGDQPRVTVVGILRNITRRDFAWYRYRFDLIRFEVIREEIAETIVSFNTTLQAGLTYRTMVRHDKNFGLLFETPLRIPIHHAYWLDWTNLDQFPVLQSLRGQSHKQIVFRVLSVDIQQMEPRRWNSTFRLEILLVD